MRLTPLHVSLCVLIVLAVMLLVGCLAVPSISTTQHPIFSPGHGL